MAAVGHDTVTFWPEGLTVGATPVGMVEPTTLAAPVPAASQAACAMPPPAMASVVANAAAVEMRRRVWVTCERSSASGVGRKRRGQRKREGESLARIVSVGDHVGGQLERSGARGG